MSTTKAPELNGTQKKADTKPTEPAKPESLKQDSTQTQEQQKPDLSNVHVNGSQVTPLTPIENRIARFEKLQELLERRDVLADSLKELENFKVTNNAGAQLTLKDARNRTFAINHPEIIAEMVALAKGKLETEIAAIDAQFIL